MAAALAARHIGGAVNYVAVAESTGMSPSAQAAGLAADNLVRRSRVPPVPRSWDAGSPRKNFFEREIRTRFRPRVDCIQPDSDQTYAPLTVGRASRIRYSY